LGFLRSPFNVNPLKLNFTSLLKHFSVWSFKAMKTKSTFLPGIFKSFVKKCQIIQFSISLFFVRLSFSRSSSILTRKTDWTDRTVRVTIIPEMYKKI
jgi:hypothetical protein